jgi:hypothetical protein
MDLEVEELNIKLESSKWYIFFDLNLGVNLFKFLFFFLFFEYVCRDRYQHKTLPSIGST